MGGRASTWVKDGFTFDIGPSWYLMPDVFEKFFARFNKKPEDYYFLTRLDPSYRVYFNDHKYTDLPASFLEVKKLFDGFEPNGGRKLAKYIEETGYYYHTALDKFLYRSFTSIHDIADIQLIKEWRTLSSLLQSFHHFVRHRFVSDEAHKILEYVNVFLGGSPANTPALYTILSYVDMKLGVWYPQGGFNSVPQGMAQLAQSYGTHIQLNQEVTGLEIKNKTVIGVKTKSGAVPADLVIFNADYST